MIGSHQKCKYYSSFERLGQAPQGSCIYREIVGSVYSKWSLRTQPHNYEGSDVLYKREASRGAEHNDQRTEKLNDQKAASSYLIRERTVNMSRLSATAVLVFALISISAAGPTEQQYRSRKYTQSRDMLIIVVLCFVPYHCKSI